MYSIYLLAVSTCNVSLVHGDDYSVSDDDITVSGYYPHSTCLPRHARLWDETADEHWCGGKNSENRKCITFL